MLKRNTAYKSTHTIKDTLHTINAVQIQIYTNTNEIYVLYKMYTSIQIQIQVYSYFKNHR
jgi:hypothetical protein